MGRWQTVRSHVWRDETGEPILRHTKKLTPKGVAFPWEHRRYWPSTGIERWFDGKGADDGIVAPLLYPLDVFAKSARTEHVHLAEGERDVDSLTAAGVLAVTAGGVAEFGANQARLLKGWRGRITIVRDNDAAGAWGAARTYNALREVGIPATRLRVARGRCKAEGADAHDHLSAGYTVEQFSSEPIAKVRRLAATATSKDFRRAGYDRPPRYDGDPGWTVVTPEEVAQLDGWRPGRAS